MLEAVEKKWNSPNSVWNSTFRKVSKCACAVCAVSKIVVCSKVVDPEGNPLWQGEMTVSNDAGSRYYKEKRGNFRILVKSGTKQIVLIIKAKFQVFELHEGQCLLYHRSSKEIACDQIPSEQEKSIPLEGSGGRPNFVDLGIPLNTFLTADGRLYIGEITASIRWLILEARQTWQQPLGSFRR